MPKRRKPDYEPTREEGTEDDGNDERVPETSRKTRSRSRGNKNQKRQKGDGPQGQTRSATPQALTRGSSQSRGSGPVVAPPSGRPRPPPKSPATNDKRKLQEPTPRPSPPPNANPTPNLRIKELTITLPPTSNRSLTIREAYRLGAQVLVITDTGSMGLREAYDQAPRQMYEYFVSFISLRHAAL